jgi:hypothetical protein
MSGDRATLQAVFIVPRRASCPRANVGLKDLVMAAGGEDSLVGSRLALRSGSVEGPRVTRSWWHQHAGTGGMGREKSRGWQFGRWNRGREGILNDSERLG